jgi:hypothetical protein
MMVPSMGMHDIVYDVTSQLCAHIIWANLWLVGERVMFIAFWMNKWMLNLKKLAM